ncbi:MAG: hypothetical protein J5I93_01790 [Pirellulaceae bacterium]|nr:hypothetical protein [Pirellulaceae bacterium]
MSRTIESIATLNSAARTVLALVVVAGVGAGGWYAYTTYHANELALAARARELNDAQQQLAAARTSLESAQQDLEASRREVAALQQQVEQQAEQIEQLDTSLRLLKVNRRVARLTVLDQRQDEESGRLVSDVEFAELDADGRPLDEVRQFRIVGDVVYIDNWIVKFEDKYVEQADIDRSTSLVLFRRIYGEFQEPSEGFPLDQVGSRPRAYGREEMSEFEQRIWDDFWNIANDEEAARQLGIRAAHGDAPFIKVKKGKSYKVLLRASDGLSIIPDDQSPAAVGPAT